MKRTVILILISSLLMITLEPFQSTAIAEVKPITFKDITGHWAEGSINQAVQKGYVQGYLDGAFRPDKNITRAEFIKLVVSSLKLTVTTETYAKWYEPYVQAARSAGIYVDGDFKKGDMNTKITRLEISSSALRATGQISQNPNDIMYRATKSGLIKGIDTKGTLGITLNATRAQSIAVIERIAQLNFGNRLEVDANAVKNAKSLLTPAKSKQ